ncbi:MAG: hypothetical protein LBK13_12710 [Spirochaetales bacterium]|nr:hypothetical protein [Spirochaetales bacterium]
MEQQFFPVRSARNRKFLEVLADFRPRKSAGRLLYQAVQADLKNREAILQVFFTQNGRSGCRHHANNKLSRLQLQNRVAILLRKIA